MRETVTSLSSQHTQTEQLLAVYFVRFVKYFQTVLSKHFQVFIVDDHCIANLLALCARVLGTTSSTRV